MSKPIIATITCTQGSPLVIRTGEVFPHLGLTCVYLTEDHIFELVTINKAWYQKQLVEGIKAGLISPNP